MADPIPHVVAASGDAADAPAGAIPISLYGADSGDGPAAVAWDDVTDKPTTFTPATHNQGADTISVVASGTLTQATAQLALEALAARVAALEAAQPGG